MKKGFTLIEMLIVVAVIAILIGIALPRFRGMQEEGLIAQAKGELRTLQTAVESYYLHNSSVYPADGSLSDITSSTPEIVSAVPDDVFNIGSAYAYDLSANGDYYAIWSVGIGGNGSAVANDAGTVTETNGSSCIFVSNAARDSAP
ncbi:type IV pilin protein [Candidatus Omnitrophota bacterium]